MRVHFFVYNGINVNKSVASVLFCPFYLRSVEAVRMGTQILFESIAKLGYNQLFEK